MCGSWAWHFEPRLFELFQRRRCSEMFQSAKERNASTIFGRPQVELELYCWLSVSSMCFFLAVGQTFGSPSTGIGMMIQTDQITLPYELFTADSFPVYNWNKLTAYTLAINNLPGMHIQAPVMFSLETIYEQHISLVHEYIYIYAKLSLCMFYLHVSKGKNTHQSKTTASPKNKIQH